MATLAPGWAETTVRFLRDRHPYLLPIGFKGSPFTEQLFNALVLAKYHYFEMVDRSRFAIPRWEEALRTMVTHDPTVAYSGWTKEKHNLFVNFFGKGGYRFMVESESKKKAAALEKIIVATDAGELREIELEMEELVDVMSSVKDFKRPELSPAHQLEEEVAGAVLRVDSRFGVW